MIHQRLSLILATVAAVRPLVSPAISRSAFISSPASAPAETVSPRSSRRPARLSERIGIGENHVSAKLSPVRAMPRFKAEVGRVLSASTARETDGTLIFVDRQEFRPNMTEEVMRVNCFPPFAAAAALVRSKRSKGLGV